MHHHIILVSGCPVVDGSGMVTGLAFHEIQQQLTAVSAEKEENRLKLLKTTEKMSLLKNEYAAERCCHNVNNYVITSS